MPSRAAVSRAAEGAKGAKGKAGAQAVPPPVMPKGGGQSPDRPEIPNWRDSRFKGKLDDLKEIADRVNKLNKQKKALEDRVKGEMVLIRAIMEDVNDHESWSVRDEDWTCMYIKPGPKKTLVPELLVQQGVSLTVIDKATKYTESTPYVQIRAPKEE